jgi:thiol-disulfide isomerase/thioredoxin
LTYVIKDIKPEDRLKLISSDGDTVTLADEKFNNKVKIVQIMGTWCPNCLDEARYFNTLYKKYNKDGLEIVAVAFENGTNTQVILDKLNKYKKVNNINYTMLYGGKAGNEFALKVFPYLNKVMSFPTAIYFDKNNKIRKIYTGFYGPGTGKYYEDYTASTEKFIEDLLAE